MGALPDREPPIGAPHRSRESAPPLWAVEARRPANEPQTPPEAPAEPPEAAPRPAPPVPPPAPAAPATPGGEDGPDKDEVPYRGLDLDRVAALRAWAAEHLRPPDLLNEASPGLKQLWEQALKGDHLPENTVLRVAEVARLVVSLPVIGAAVLLAWSCVSAARQAALILAVLSLWVVGSALVSAVLALF
ncbi:hypothetical protein ABZ234_07815 [Nocardiopsis sp. NPDC006198]|uniref:hypothetical protein n=1 Tax=Nocardiopsis sp. NPDC006198 TaxID=3154472 RepID=UPI00339F1176